MGQAANQIEQHIRDERRELEQNFSQLEAKVKDTLDWKSQFQQHPGAVLGAALVGGVLLAALLPKSRNGNGNGSHAYDENVASRAHSFSEEEPSYESAPSRTYSSYTPKTRSAANDTWDNLKAAAIGLASTRLSEYIDDFAPGFTDHYRKAASSDRGRDDAFYSRSSTPQRRNNGSTNPSANTATDHESHS